MRTLLSGLPHALAQPVCDALLVEGIESRVVRPFTSLAGYGPTPPAEIVILNDDDSARALSVAAGENPCLALLTNRTIVGWGNNTAGQITLPAGTTNVFAIAAGSLHSAATLGPVPPTIWVCTHCM